ncbi:DUF927 domain-containing protein [Jannaschia sp. KMU-145]|uniref:DUF927 domain-containing protein n=1 Tax=Jannaschia halovivens TaxID=3388667 RepID=UPI00396B4774
MGESEAVAEAEAMAEDEAMAEEAPPELWNDTELWGEDCPEWCSLLSRPITFSVGADIRKPFTTVSESFGDWLDAPVTRNGAGLTRHVEAAKKEGPCIVFGALVGKDRRADAVVSVAALGLDQDDGPPIEATAARLEAAGIACLIQSTFNDGTTTIKLKRDAVMNTQGLTQAPTDEDVRGYLRGLGKYRDEVCDAAEVEGEVHESGGLMLIVRVPPLRKARFIFPLTRAVTITDTAPTHREAKELFADKVMGLAIEVVGIPPDTSCTDPSRAFYLARHPEGEEPLSILVRGKPLDYDDIPAVSKRDYLAERRSRQSGRKSGGGFDALSEDGSEWKAWVAENARRFLIADALEERARRRVSADKIELECPYDHEHSNPGDPNDTAFYVENADGETGFRAGCGHDSCQGRDRLAFLARMIAEGWLEESDLEEDGPFLLPLSDDELIDDAASGEAGVAGEEPSRAYAWLPKGFIYRNGSFWQKSGDEKRPVCAAFDLVGRTSNATGNDDAGRLISFVNENAETVEVVIDRASIFNDGRGVISDLAARGMIIHDRRTGPDDLLNLLARATTNRQIFVFRRPGWVRDRAASVEGFLLPSGHYVNAGKGSEVRLSENATMRDRGPGGTFEVWRESAATAFDNVETNFHWSFALCAGFAGPIMGLLSDPSCGVNLSGKSSSGKTIGLRAAASVWGAVKDQQGVFFPMNSTTNAVEDLASIGSETVLCLDDLSNMANAKDLSAMLFSLSGSAGKARKKGRGAGLAVGAEYAAFTLFSNERGLKTTIDRAGRVGDFKTGIAVRFPDVDVTGGVEVDGGTIGRLDDFKANFGHAGPAFVSWLISEDWPNRQSELAALVASAQREIAGDDASTQLFRAARAFALVRVGGELAADADILPNRETVARAVATAFAAFKDSAEGQATNGGDRLIEGLRSFFALNQNRRIIAANEADDPGHSNVVGWYDADVIILDATATEDIQVLGLSGSQSELIDALSSRGMLRTHGRNRFHYKLPSTVKVEGQERKLKHIQIDRAKLG